MAKSPRCFYVPHNRVQIAFDDPSRTMQSMRDECDINGIMRKYEKHGLLDHLNAHQGDYGDFSSFTSYHDSMNQVRLADEMFMTIPAKTREVFRNDPSAFLQFAQDPANAEKMVEYGLAVATAPDAPTEASEKLGATPPPSEEEPPPEA